MINAPSNSERNTRSSLLLALLIFTAQANHGWATSEVSPYNTLTPEQQKAISMGKEVVVSQNLGTTWPNIIVYKRVNASPEKIKDLFLNYEAGPSYIPNLKSVVIQASPNPTVKDIRYTVKLPLLMTVSYLVRNSYQKTKYGHIINWTLLESPIASKATGSISIDPYGPSPDGQTNVSIIKYQNHIEPSSKLLKPLKAQAIKEAIATVNAIAQKAESLH
jgi:hypothetical protein